MSCLRAFDNDALEYVGKDDIISMFGGKMRFRAKDRLYNIEGFPVTKYYGVTLTVSVSV